MKPITSFLIGIAALVTTLLISEASDPNIDWLLNQQVPNSVVTTPAANRSGMVISYIVDSGDSTYPFIYNRSWVYDDAVAGIAFALNNQCSAAQSLFTALAAELESDGSIGFSFNTADTWHDELYRTGAIAWVGYAFTLYRDQCNDTQFAAAIDSLATWVISMQDGTNNSAKGGPDVAWFSTEHNIDAYFFLSNAGYTTEATKIKQSLINNHWNSDYGCFQQGIGDDYKVLDVASWGALFLLDIGEVNRAASCLSYLETQFAHSETCTINGSSQTISAYKPDQGTDVVWSEGALGVAMAYDRIGNTAKRDQILAEVAKMRDANGGIIYACPESGDFSTRESVAGTGWLAMVNSAERNRFWTTPDASFTDELTAHDSSRWLRAGVWSNGGVFANVWLPDHVTFDGEKMSLRIDDKNQSGGNCPTGCDGKPYAAGAYRTHALYGYGCFEARMKPIGQSGVVSSLFTYNDSFNKPPDGDGQFLHNEIDIEFVGKDTTRFQANFYTQGWDSHEHWIDLGYDAASSFQNYGFKWTDDTIRWYVNGTEVYSVTNSATITVPTITAGGSQRLFMNTWPVTQAAGVEAWAGPFSYSEPLSAEYEWIRYEAGADCTFTPFVPTSAVELKSAETATPSAISTITLTLFLLLTILSLPRHRLPKKLNR